MLAAIEKLIERNNVSMVEDINVAFRRQTQQLQRLQKELAEMKQQTSQAIEEIKLSAEPPDESEPPATT